MPRPGQVLGLVGTNGIGKSTALKILSGKLKPNLGRYDSPPDWEEILKYFRGSELQSVLFNEISRGQEANSFADYFTKVLEDDLKAVVKPQYVDQLPKAVKGPDKSVESLIKARAQMDNMDHIMDVLGMLRCYLVSTNVRLISLQSLSRSRIETSTCCQEVNFSASQLL